MADVWIAKQDITYEGAVGYRPGDEVPAENVKRHGWEDFVVRPGTKTAEAVTKPDA